MSATPSLTNPEIISSLLTTDNDSNHIVSPQLNSTSQVDYYTDQRSRVFKCYFVIAAIFFTSFCVLCLYLQHRRKIRATLKKRDAEDTGSRARVNAHMTLPNSIGVSNDPQEPRNLQDNLYEGLDAHGEAPPPYAQTSKPPGFREVNGIIASPVTAGVTNTEQQFSSEEPPTYNEHVISVQNQNLGDTSATRPPE